MKPILTLLSVLALAAFASAAPFSIAVPDGKQVGLTAVVAGLNAKAKEKYDAEWPAGLVSKTDAKGVVTLRPAFVPITNDQYLTARVQEILSSYDDQVSQGDIDALTTKLKAATAAKRAAARTAAENALK